jgi:predicted CopG family antitoxin
LSETAEKQGKSEKHLTSIRVTKETVELLKERGRKGESYDDIIRKLLEKRRR